MHKLFLFILINAIFSLDYSREDVNPTSETFGQEVGPSFFLAQGKLTMTIFNWET